MNFTSLLTLPRIEALRPLFFAFMAAAVTYLSIDTIIALRTHDSLEGSALGEITLRWGEREETISVAPPATESIEATALMSLPTLKDGESDAKHSAPLPRNRWNTALTAWKRGDAVEAARHFAAIAQAQAGAPSDRAAAAYWAYRAHRRIDNEPLAEAYLRKAAQYPHTFYGILATRALGDRIAVPAVKNGRRVAQVIGTSRHKVLQSDAFPIPNWKQGERYEVDPALLFAVIRKESGFNSAARSPAGARGLMQIMPATARFVAKQIGMNNITNVKLLDRETNLTLGQAYIRHLLEDESVNGNLLYLLAAYNAGPGNLQKWLKKAASEDPLLFVESLPVAETRAYVRQVMANYWIYQEVMGQYPTSLTLLLNGQWPSYMGSGLEVASLKSSQTTSVIR